MANLRIRRAVLPAAVTAVAATVAVSGAVWLGGNANADTDPTATPNLAKAAAAAQKLAKSAAKDHAGVSARTARSVSATDELNFGDLNGDGKADLAAVDAAGTLYVYPGKAYVYPGTGTRSKALFGTRFKVGTGWNKFTSIIRHGDFNGDGKQDILTRGAKGNLTFYAGTGSAPNIVKKGSPAGTGWNTFVSITGAGDVNTDGRDDLLAQAKNGDLFLYTGTNRPSAPFSSRGTKVGTGFKGDLLTAAGDITNRDGRSEFFFRNTAKKLFLFNSKDGLNPLGRRELVTDRDGVPLDFSDLKNQVGMGNLTSDASYSALPDLLWQTTDGYLILVPVDSDAIDNDLVIGSGFRNFRLF